MKSVYGLLIVFSAKIVSAGELTDRQIRAMEIPGESGFEEVCRVVMTAEQGVTAAEQEVTVSFLDYQDRASSLYRYFRGVVSEAAEVNRFLRPLRDKVNAHLKEPRELRSYLEYLKVAFPKRKSTIERLFRERVKRSRFEMSPEEDAVTFIARIDSETDEKIGGEVRNFMNGYQHPFSEFSVVGTVLTINIPEAEFLVDFEDSRPDIRLAIGYTGKPPFFDRDGNFDKESLRAIQKVPLRLIVTDERHTHVDVESHANRVIDLAELENPAFIDMEVHEELNRSFRSAWADRGIRSKQPMVPSEFALVHDATTARDSCLSVLAQKEKTRDALMLGLMPVTWLGKIASQSRKSVSGAPVIPSSEFRARINRFKARRVHSGSGASIGGTPRAGGSEQ